MIRINDLSFSYGSNAVLEGISLELQPGKVYGLLGENGVGKTTLLTLLCGLKKPHAGSIDCDGRDPWNREPEFLEDLCYLPDEVAPVPQPAATWASYEGILRKDFDINKFKEIMGLFETDINKKMNAMSSGQLKKTYIAFALSCGARYILMDEPTNGLDIPSKVQFRSALLKYTREDAIILISTHQVRDLENVIDPIVILDRRSVLLNASIEQICSKLYFDYGTEIHPDALYVERLPGGAIQVIPNATGEDSKFNIEALFGAVYANKETIRKIFSNE